MSTSASRLQGLDLTHPDAPQELTLDRRSAFSKTMYNQLLSESDDAGLMRKPSIRSMQALRIMCTIASGESDCREIFMIRTSVYPLVIIRRVGTRRQAVEQLQEFLHFIRATHARPVRLGRARGTIHIHSLLVERYFRLAWSRIVWQSAGIHGG